MTPRTGMILVMTILFGVLAGSYRSLGAVETVDCAQFKLNDQQSEPLQKVSLPPTKQCKPRVQNGVSLPDPACTPGAINPSVTAEMLRNPNFRTSCLRGHATTESAKEKTYQWYGIEQPKPNGGASQLCELDHLISLELGGADTLANIWPQCGPQGVALIHRFFKEKDIVENYLAKQIREGTMDLKKVQQGIATDWTQYLDDAKKACPRKNCGESVP